MKILYAIQGTGNGHICRAYDIVPILSKKAEVDVLISGIQSDIKLPFPVKYVYNGLSFIFGKKGGIDLVQTYRKSRLKQLLKEVHELPVEQYDLVISDFEPVSSWACVLKNKPCISLSHQSAVINKKSPQPKKIDPVGKSILKIYAPAFVHYGFHFESYDENIFTPVIRKEVREAIITNEGHYTVYLPAYSDKRIIRVLSECKGIKWHVFSKHFEHLIECENIRVSPIDNADFISSIASSAGVLCGAGFETPAEVMFLKKKLMVIPMKNQFEQHCNAAALKKLGVPVMKSLKTKHLEFLQNWIENGEPVNVVYPDQTGAIIDTLIEAHVVDEFDPQPDYDSYNRMSMKDFKKQTIKKILFNLSN